MSPRRRAAWCDAAASRGSDGRAVPAAGGRGALILGGDQRALGAVRSLGRHGVCAWVVRSRQDRALAGSSRFSRRHLIWPDDPEGQLAYLVDLCDREALDAWLPPPSADATAAFVARNNAELGKRHRLITPDWSSFRWADDKRLTYRLAEELGLPFPRTFTPRSADEV